MYCDHKTAGGGWTVFQKRRDGSVDFHRNWDAYKRGFGNVRGEFWLGLDKIHRLTLGNNTKLHVDLEDNHGNTAFAEYDSFTVASERAKYRLSLGRYSGAFLKYLLTAKLTCAVRFLVERNDFSARLIYAETDSP